MPFLPRRREKMTFNITGKIRISDYENVLIIPFRDRGKAIAILEEQESAQHPFVCEIKQNRPKRSRNANNFAWELMTQIADKLKTSKEEIYIQMLDRYGQREPELYDMVAEAYPAFQRATESHCTVVDTYWTDRKWYKAAILIGSSNYDSKQMSILIDGIVSEAEPMGIDVLTPQERSLLIDKWGKNEQIQRKKNND
jgi:hypothetical protein